MEGQLCHPLLSYPAQTWLPTIKNTWSRQKKKKKVFDVSRVVFGKGTSIRHSSQEAPYQEVI